MPFIRKNLRFIIPAATLFVGVGIGQADSSSTPTAVKTVTLPGPTVTRDVPGPTVTVPGPTVTQNVPGPTVTVPGPAPAPVVKTVNKTPQSCLDALDISAKAFGMTSEGFSAAGDMMTALQNGDVSAASSAVDRIHAAGKEIGPLADKVGPLSDACRASK